MKWFKHYSDMRFDPKIRRLIGKYKMDGYGIYNAIIESIAYQLDSEKPIPDLEENSKDIAEMFGMDTMRVEEIIQYCLKEELFVIHPQSGRIVCLKMLAHLDNTMSTNPEIRKILDNFNKLKETSSHLKQIIVSETIVSETIEPKTKTRKDKNQKHSSSKPLKHQYMETVYFTTAEYFKLKTAYGRDGVRERAENLNLYQMSKGKKYPSSYATILNWERMDKKKNEVKTPNKETYVMPKTFIGKYK